MEDIVRRIGRWVRENEGWLVLSAFVLVILLLLKRREERMPPGRQ